MAMTSFTAEGLAGRALKNATAASGMMLYVIPAVLVALFVIWLARRNNRNSGVSPRRAAARRTGLMGLIFLGVGVLACAYSGSLIKDQIVFRLNASPVVEAQIEDIVEVVGAKGGHRYIPKVLFKTSRGQPVIGYVMYSLSEAPTIGSKTNIQYDIRDPTQVQLVDRWADWGSWTILMALGVFLLLSAIPFICTWLLEWNEPE